MKRNQTNTERVTEYMTFGSPMNQLFLVDAVYKLAELVLKDREDTLQQMKNGFVSGEAWIKAAEDWKASKDKQVDCCDICNQATPGLRPVRDKYHPEQPFTMCNSCFEAREDHIEEVR